jgi:hypothetical protein
MGCDGYYHLLPVEDEGDVPRYNAQNEILMVVSENLIVKILGGATQPPFTRKVEAGHLWISVRIDSKKPVDWYITQPTITTDTGWGATADYLYASHRSRDTSKKRKLYDLSRRDNDAVENIQLNLAPGTAWCDIHFYSFYDRYGFLVFPITVDLGRIICAGDTIDLHELKFNATRRLEERPVSSSEFRK